MRLIILQENIQAFFGHSEKNSRPKKLKDPEKLKEIVKKASSFCQLLNFLVAALKSHIF